MNEASKNDYFIDGFMIKHFGIWPLVCDKDNLFEEQKIFLIYLLGVIPEKEDWTMQVEYKRKLNEIKNITSVELDKTDFDLANIQGENVDEMRKRRLHEEKNKLIKELNEKYGIESGENKEEDVADSIEFKNDSKQQKEELWDILCGKGLIKK